MNNRRYKVSYYVKGLTSKHRYFKNETSMQEYVMMQTLSGNDVSVFDQHNKSFIRMSERTKNIKKFIQEIRNNDEQQ